MSRIHVPAALGPVCPPDAGPYTTLVRGGLWPDPVTGAVSTPLYQSTTFAQPAVGQDTGYTYSRSANPTVEALERNLGAIEGSLPAACFATGMAAITALCLATLRSGDHVICGDVVYGGTVRLLRQVLAPLGVQASFVDGADPAAFRAALRPTTKLVLVESPANPTLKLTDIAAVAEVLEGHPARLAVDNTFLTPVLQRPLDLGADVVIYSTTKYTEGHNGTVGGAVLCVDEALDRQVRFVRNATGSGQSPFEAWLTLRGLKTLPLRMERHCANATEVARFLEAHDRVARVHFPGLDSFAQRALADRQQAGPGAIVAFEVTGGVQAGIDTMNGVRLCTLAENLGATETLITHPASMTHADVPAADRRAAGISDGLIRLSVGLEDAADLCADLDRALCGAGGAK